MTIYILDEDPKKTAEMLDDKSLERIIKEIAQVLCNVCYWSSHYGHYEKEPYKYLKKDVPLEPSIRKDLYTWSQWARECKANYLYLVELGLACDSEVLYRVFVRYEIPKYTTVIRWARDNVPDLPECNGNTEGSCDIPMTLFPLVMPKKYIVKCPCHTGRPLDVVESYRNYYKAKLKKHFKVTWAWRGRKKPEFINLE